MDVLIETLDAKRGEWKSETAAQVRHGIIGLADQNALDRLRSRRRHARA